MTGAVIVLVLAGLLMVWITGVVAAAVPASSVSAVLLLGVVIAAVVLVAGGVRGAWAVWWRHRTPGPLGRRARQPLE